MSHRHNVITLTERGPGACPGSESLAAHFAGDTNSRIADHLAACPECREILRALRPLRAFQQDLRSGLAAPGHARRFPALASAAILLVGCGLWLLLTEANRESANPHPRTARRSAQVVTTVAPADRAVLPAAPIAFEFENPNDARAELLLFDRGLRPVWQSEVHQASRIALPPAVRDSLHPGETYLWKVTLASGVTRQTSPLYSFTLARSGHAADRRLE